MSAEEQLETAIKKKSLEDVKQALSQIKDLDDCLGRQVYQPGPEGQGGWQTYLHMASVYGTIDIMKALVGAGASVNVTNHEGQTPLMHLFVSFMTRSKGWVKRAKYLIDQGSDETKVDKNNKTSSDHLKDYIKYLNSNDKSEKGMMAKSFMLLRKLKPEMDIGEEMKSSVSCPKRFRNVWKEFQDLMRKDERTATVTEFPLENVNEAKKLHNSMRKGTGKYFCLRFHVVGHYEAGKTSLMKQILRETCKVNREHNSTDGVDIYVGRCDIDVKTEDWIKAESVTEKDRRMELITQCLQDMGFHGDEKGSADADTEVVYDQRDSISSQRDTTAVKGEVSGPVFASTVTDSQMPASPDILSGTDNHFKATFDKLKEKQEQAGDRTTKKAIVRGVDFGGQCVYYTTHQVFLSPIGINIIAIDITKDLEDEVQDEDHRHLGSDKTAKVKEFIKFWIKTLSRVQEKKKVDYPRIIIVATHKDEMHDKSQIKPRIQKVREYLKDQKLETYVVYDIFCVDCFDGNDEDIHTLRRKLVEIAKQDTDSWGKEVSMKWLYLEDKILSSQERKQVMTIDEVKTLNRQSSLNLEDEDLKEFLHFHHEIGNFLYYHKEGVDNLVITDPQWMIDSLKQFITCHEKDSSLQKCENWKQFKENGVMHKSLLEQIWGKCEERKFACYQEELLTLMGKLDIIASHLKYDKNGNQDHSATEFIVPCMLKAAPEKFDSDWETKRSMAFVFSDHIFQPDIFYRLLAFFIARSCERQSHDLYCDKAVFQYAADHFVYLTLGKNSINVHLSRANSRTVNSDVCYAVRVFLSESLQSIIGDSENMKEMLNCQKRPTKDTDIEESEGRFRFDCEEGETEIICHCFGGMHPVNIEEISKPWKGYPKQSYKPVDTPLNLDSRLSPFWLGRAALHVDVRKWYSLACCLGVSQASDKVELEHEDSHDKIYHILHKWFCENTDATLGKLIEETKDNEIKIDHNILKDTDQTWREGISDSILDREVLCRDVDIFSAMVCHEFFRLGIELKLRHEEICNIKLDKKIHCDRVREMLKLWKENNGKNATYKVLGDAAYQVQIGKMTILEHLCEETRMNFS